MYDYIRDFSSKPMCTMEAVVSAAAKDVLDLDASLILVVTTTGVPAHLITKYRPKVSSASSPGQTPPLFRLWVLHALLTCMPGAALGAVRSIALDCLPDSSCRELAQMQPPNIAPVCLQVPVLVVTPSESVARQCGLHYALHPYVVPALPASRQDVEFDVLLEEALLVAVERQLLRPGGEVVVIHGYKGAAAEQCPMLTIKVRTAAEPAFQCRQACLARH